jgi:hypothetical protein
MSDTLLERVEEQIKQALIYNKNAEAPPVALIWPDRERQFTAAAEKLRLRIPLLTYGEMDETARCGPAYWLRCVVARTVNIGLQDDPPVVYLPGVGRDDLRAIEDCPRELAPIAELQYRSQWFAHSNGKDWTVRALLSNRDFGLGLDVGEDPATTEALLGAFGELLAIPMRRLESQYIDAEFLHRLLNPDPVARLLEWLDDPVGFRARIEPPQWNAFLGFCRSEYDFDPSAQGEITGGRMLGERKGAWAEVWKRFEQNPERYSHVESALRKSRPLDLFAESEDSWPQTNDEAEMKLRTQLLKLKDSTAGEARVAIARLWEQNQKRRNWVWARLDKAPLVFSLEQLDRLAQLTAAGPSGSVKQLVAAYVYNGWQADAAFLASLRAVADTGSRDAVAAAALAVYRPWLDAHARALQEAIGPLTNTDTYSPGGEASTAKGTVTIFVDGLRYDLAQRLLQRLGGYDADVSTSLAAIPTVTETAKPILVPVADGSLTGGKDLGTVRASNGTKATIATLRTLMTERGVQVLQGMEIGDPTGVAWTEAADLDKRGHDFGIALVDEIDKELDHIARRIKLLLEAGWRQVDVVTDHGWILLPGGLEKIELPAATVELKKGRCARLKDGAEVPVPTVPWYWNNHVRIALAPGIGCFEANKEYEHGGVSLQECVVPRISVRSGERRTITGGAAITKVKWIGLMCRIEIENVAPGATADIRRQPANPQTSMLSSVRETTSAGKLALYVENDSFEGEDAYVVIVDNDDRILAQHPVRIGANR